MRRIESVATAAVAWALVGALVIVAGATPAQACSCAGGSDDEFIEQADAVFTGRLSSIELPGFASSTMDLATYTFEVDAVFKGDVAATQVIRSPISGASCGIEFIDEGDRMFVFATKDRDGLRPGPDAEPLGPGELHAHLCSGTRVLQANEPAPAVAGAPRPPSPAPASSSSPRLAVAIVGLVLAAVVAVVSSLLLAKRRRRLPPPPTFGAGTG